MMMLKQRVAIVTAAAGGMGAECARAIAAAGGMVAIADSRDGSALAREIEASGGHAMTLTADVTDEAAALAMASTVADHFGRIDILVNGTGCEVRRPGSIDDIALPEWDRLVGASLRSIFVCARAAVPFMRRGRGGHIINLCPLAGGDSAAGFLHASARGAILALTDALARELRGSGIGVSAITKPADLLRSAPWSPRPANRAMH